MTARYSPERLERVIFLAPEADLSELLRLALDRPPDDERDRILSRLFRRLVPLGRSQELRQAFGGMQDLTSQAAALAAALPDLDAAGARSLLGWLKTQPAWNQDIIQSMALPLYQRMAQAAGLDVAAFAVLDHIQEGVLSWESLLQGIEGSENPAELAPLVKELLSEMPAGLQQQAAELTGITPPESSPEPEWYQAEGWVELAWDDFDSWAAVLQELPGRQLERQILDFLGSRIVADYGYLVSHLKQLLPHFSPEHRQALFNRLVLSCPDIDSPAPPIVLASAKPELIAASPEKVRSALRKLLRLTASSPFYAVGNYTQPIEEFGPHTLALDGRSSPAALAVALAEKLHTPCAALGWLARLLDELEPVEAVRLLERLPRLAKRLGWEPHSGFSLAGCSAEWPTALKAALLKVLPRILADDYPAKALFCAWLQDEEQEAAFQGLLQAFEADPGGQAAWGDDFRAWAALHLAQTGRTAQALDWLERIEDQGIATNALVGIAGMLQPGDLEPALEFARRLPGLAERPYDFYDLPRDRALTALAERMIELDQPLQACATAWEIAEMGRAAALRRIAPRLEGLPFDLAWRAAQDIDFLPARLEALGALALRLPEPRRSDQLSALFDQARYEGIDELISATAAGLPEALLPRAVQAAHLQARRISTYACAQLLPHLQGEARQAMAWHILSYAVEGGRGGGGGSGMLLVSPLSAAEVAPLVQANLGPLAGGGQPPVKRRREPAKMAPSGGGPGAGGGHGGGRPPAGAGVPGSVPAGVPAGAGADAGEVDFGLTPADEESAEPVPAQKVINTGFASRSDPREEIDPKMSLQSGGEYHFWLDVDLPSEKSIETTRVGLPELPPKTVLSVTLVGYRDGLIVDPQANRGSLRQDENGAWAAAEQPLGSRAPQTDKSPIRLYFPVGAPQEPGTYRMRCNIYWGQVLLQSRLVSARCVASPKLGKSAALRSRLDYHLSSPLLAQNYRKLPAHRLSVLLNSNGDGTHSFHFKGGDSGHDFQKDDLRFGEGELQGMIQQARGTLHLVSWDKAEEWKKEFVYRYKDQAKNRERMLKDLGRLAKWGFEFYFAILEKLTDGFDPAKMDEFEALMKTPGYVQFALKESPSYILPAALIYDYPLDSSQPITLCPEFDRAFNLNQDLETCACFQGECPSRGQDTILCPSGFWGFRHYLGLPLSLEGKLDAPATIPYHDRPQVLMGEYVDFEKVAAHIDRLDDLPIELNPLSDLGKLLSAMKGSSHLLYFYCHGGLLREKPFLQIGRKGSPGDLEPAAFLAKRIRWLQDPHPLVILNGCHTSAVEPLGALSLLRSFLVFARASGLIGTEITIFEELATEFGEELFRRLVAGQTVGEAVRGARLKLLRQGNPLGLVYTPFVNAGVRLEKVVQS